MYQLTKKLGRDIAKQVESNFEEQSKLLAELVRAKSVNPGDGAMRSAQVEVKVAKLIRGKFRDWGLRPRYLRARSGRPNLVTTWGPARSRKSILLVGHMDTGGVGSELINTPFSGIVRDGRLYGVGALDMKATLSAYMFAYKALADLGVRLDGKLRMAFVADGMGEGASKIGLAYLINKGIKAKAAILGKPGTDKIAIGHRGGYRFLLKTYGEAVNTGRRAWERGKKGKNAILQMDRVMRVLSGFDLPFKPARAFPGRLPVFTFPTKIKGGTSVNVVPDKCEAWGDVRLMPGNTDVQVRLWIEDRLSGLTDLEWDLEDLLFVPSMEIERSEGLVQVLAEQAKEVLGKQPKLEGCGPWNDAWMLTSRDVPCIAGFGPDGGEGAEGEWVDLESLRKVTEIYARTILEYLGERKVGVK
ncbi:M20 family metallopeptidase [Candidatus Chazhemtobacterium aquaticus]|uniref:Acetylornithine deacetylase n=1 Tax=Candidatus Chazhemtobacterium aquaticus TaxID=2715735 RepID=A0A857N9G7_9BACT|nr:M20 family metallopeptidase [Candidatus Chazhemtobacterium aquaticus]QHO63070.1 Acetylornithine deacetylase [Candidatus Chazhemtobacterium aquaticus]